MKQRIQILIAFGLCLFFSFSSTSEDKFKCLVQLNDYEGEGAYVVVSLMSPNMEYEKTLYVFGKEKRWYDDIPQWWRFYSASRDDLDGISGASITAGNRKLISLTIDDSVFDKGYFIRFETAVEHKEYYEKDLEIEFNTTNIGVNKSGEGYIKNIKLIRL